MMLCTDWTGCWTFLGKFFVRTIRHFGAPSQSRVKSAGIRRWRRKSKEAHAVLNFSRKMRRRLAPVVRESAPRIQDVRCTSDVVVVVESAAVMRQEGFCVSSPTRAAGVRQKGNVRTETVAPRRRSVGGSSKEEEEVEESESAAGRKVRRRDLSPFRDRTEIPSQRESTRFRTCRETYDAKN